MPIIERIETNGPVGRHVSLKIDLTPTARIPFWLALGIALLMDYHRAGDPYRGALMLGAFFTVYGLSHLFILILHRNAPKAETYNVTDDK